MVQQVCRARVTLPSTNSYVDDCSFSLTFEATGSNPNLDFSTSNTPQAVVENFLNSIAGTQVHDLNYYLAVCLSRISNACTIEWTDITAHLDGSPAGSPFRVDQFTLGGSSSGTMLAAGSAVCVAFRAGYGSTIEHGTIADLPSTDDAQDQGAPPTHPGRTRPRARMRSRLYLGPLIAVTVMDSVNPDFSAAFLADVGFAANGLAGIHNSGAANQFQLVSWSRRGAEVNTIGFYYVNEAPAYQRRRGDVTANRVHNWVAVS